jgi:Rieske Fe-S protein
MDTASKPTPPTESVAGRRTVLHWLTYGLGGLDAVLVGLPFLGYLFGARKAAVKWVLLGLVDDFPLNQTRLMTFDNPLRQPWDGMVAQTGVYVRYEGRDKSKESDETRGYKFLVLVVNCAHLGCPVEWFAESGLFLCPCHGGVYYADGTRASGPPPQGLYSCVYRVTRVNGVDLLEIQAPHFPTLQNPEQRG